MKKSILYIIMLVITCSVFGQNIFTVTKTTDPNPFTDPFNNDDALCDPDMYGTLQWAINKANFAGGEPRIEFNIPGTGVQEILINTYLPQIKSNVTIDGTTQAGYTNGNPIIKINGQFKVQFGFNIYGADVKVIGLHIANFSNNAFLLYNSSNSEITDNVITNIYAPGIGLQIIASNYVEIYGNNIESNALNTAGTAKYGVYIDQSENCIVGSTEPGKANTIANCTKAGVAINGYKFNKISGNIIYNNPLAIQLGATANDNILPPVITSYTNGILSGTALPNSTIEVFGSTGPENANEYLASVVADGGGDWSLEVSTVYEYFVGTDRDNNENNSKLSEPIQTYPNNCVTPNQPEGIYIYNIGKNTAKVSWTPVTANASEIITYYWVVDTLPTTEYNYGICSGNTQDTSAVIFGINPEYTYYFKVYAKTSCDDLSSEYSSSKKFWIYVNSSLFVVIKENLSDYELSVFDSLKTYLLNLDEVLYFEKIYDGLNNEKLDNYFHLGCAYNDDSIKIVLDQTNLFTTVFFEPKIDFNPSCNVNCDGAINPTGQTSIIQDNYAYEMLNLPCAWGITTGNSAINIAVLDQDFHEPYYHPDLENVINSYHSIYTSNKPADEPGPDPNICEPFHGVAVAGIIAANPYNEIGLTGAGYDITVNAYCTRTPSDYMSDLHHQIAQAIVDGNKIINICYQYVCYSDFATHTNGYTPQTDIDVFTGYVDAGAVIVLSGGNEPLIFEPALDYGNKHQISAIPGVIVVGGVDRDNRVPFNDDAINGGVTDETAELTNHYAFAINEHVTICAPAKDVWTTTLSCDGTEYTYHAIDGTSFSTPFVSAAVGLMLSVNPDLTPEQIENILISTAEPISNFNTINGLIEQYNADRPDNPDEHFNYFKAGRLNTYQAVLVAQNYNESITSSYIAPDEITSFNEETIILNNLIVEGTLTLNSTLVQISETPEIVINDGGHLIINNNGKILSNNKSFYFGNITINGGGKLEIMSGTILDFFETIILVNEGGELVIDNAKIANSCGGLWQGIRVKGDKNYLGNIPYTNPGKLEIKNHSEIHNASIGVWASNNAVAKITDSKFYNCPTGVWLSSFDESFVSSSWNPTLKPRAFVSRTEFITDDNFISNPWAHVYLLDVDKMTLKGNKYMNITSEDLLHGSARGKGIYGVTATFSVIENQGLFNPPDFNVLPQNKSVFEGLYYGIYARTTSANTATIRNCDFKNYGFMGVYLQNVIAPKITSNTFNKEQGGMTKNVALYLKSCTGYNIENNTFNEGGYGMIVNNSGPNANKVYRNHFNSPSQGLHAYYTNSNTDGSLGLFVQCNDYHNNNGVQNFIKDGNVKKQQGYFHPQFPQNSESAANQFEITNLDEETESAFRTSWLYSFNDYKYWCNELGDGITDITGYTSSTVTVGQIIQIFNATETCPSKIGYIAIDYEREISTRKSDISSLNDNLDDIVDGGSTAQVLQKVQNLNANNFNKTCNELLNLSPYLSDTVLVTFMQTSVNGHVVAKTNVLAANSPLPPYALAELENMDLPAPHKNYLAQMQTGTNAVVLLKEEIGNTEFNKNLFINEYVSHGLNNDSIPMFKDSVVNFLMNDDYFESKCMVIPILISDDRYVDAQTQINELDYLASNQNPVLHAELSEFADLQELIIQIDTTTSSESLLDIVENNLTMLESMAYNPSHRGSSVAQILLSEAGIAEFEPEIFLPMEDRSMRFSTTEEVIAENFDLSDIIEVYPTPASSEIWIEYLLIDSKPVSKIDIFDVEGKLVLSQNIRNGFGLERVDVSQLSEGNYIVKMGDFSKQISVMK